MWLNHNRYDAETISVNADGGSRCNPGPAAIGILVWDENRIEISSYKECIGDKTNNEAEYIALIKALELAMKHTRKRVHIFMDSELVIKQMNGRYRVKADNLRPLFLGEYIKKCVNGQRSLF